MKNARGENVLGALALALTDGVMRETQDQAPEPGSAAAAIVLLGHEPGLAIERLRRALGLSHPGAVRLVDRLVGDGLVERQASAKDRRAVALHLTPAGEASRSAILSARQGLLAQAFALLATEEQARFVELCEKMLRGVLTGGDHASAVCRLCNDEECTECPVEGELQARAAMGG